ncbi:hypothetical protein [Acidiphilium sp. C61]|uniref:hypothetical protein n=1 Tax=Acidiphilium sp. C61 TaxID=1671485 RepID=UPI003530295F
MAALLLTPGQASDISGARALLPTIPPPEELIADKAYDADDLRASSDQMESSDRIKML